MPRHKLKSLALLTVLVAAPANAGRHPGCPQERAAAARNAEIVARLDQARKAPTRITLTDRLSTADSLLGGSTALMRP